MNDVDLDAPRTVWEIFATAFATYRSLPLLFLSLSAILEVPLLVLAYVLGNSRHGTSATAALIVFIVQFVLVNPTLAVLQVQAVSVIGERRRPTFGLVLRMALPVLPVAIAAEIIAGIGIVAGLFFFVIPGVYLLVRWAAVAQTAAVEHTDWPTALSRSMQLTRGQSWRVFGVLLIGGLLNEIPTQVANAGNGTGQAVLSIVLLVLVTPLVTLMASYLYFDLRAREANAPWGTVA